MNRPIKSILLASGFVVMAAPASATSVSLGEFVSHMLRTAVVTTTQEVNDNVRYSVIKAQSEWLSATESEMNVNSTKTKTTIKDIDEEE